MDSMTKDEMIKFLQNALDFTEVDATEDHATYNAIIDHLQQPDNNGELVESNASLKDAVTGIRLKNLVWDVQPATPSTSFDVLQHLRGGGRVTEDHDSRVYWLTEYNNLWSIRDGETEQHCTYILRADFLRHLFNGDLKPYTPQPVLKQLSASYTHDPEAEMYYFAPSERAPGPYKKQIKISAMVDIASDGSFAGVEFDSAQIKQPEGAS